MILKTQRRKSETVSYGLSEVSPKDKPWDVHGSERDLVRDAYEFQGYLSYAQKMSECSQWLDFVVKSSDRQAIMFKLQSARFCRLRYCPICQWRRSLKWRARFFEVLPKILEDYPEIKFIFLTLTIKNCELEQLRATVGEMNKAWNKLVKRKQFPALGWLKSLEVTKSKDFTAHPHFHCLLAVPSNYFSSSDLYISQPLWRQLWRKSLKIDYNPVVNVKRVRPKPGNQNQSGLLAAVCETLKYSTKPGDLTDSPVWLSGLTQQMHQLRAISLGGILKPYLSDLGQETETEDLVHIDSEPEEKTEEQARCRFNWNSNQKRYLGV